MYTALALNSLVWAYVAIIVEAWFEFPHYTSISLLALTILLIALSFYHEDKL